jgi:hypothetical protein
MNIRKKIARVSPGVQINPPIEGWTGGFPCFDKEGNLLGYLSSMPSSDEETFKTLEFVKAPK